MRFSLDGLLDGIVNLLPPGREPLPVFVFCFDTLPPVPFWEVTLFFTSRSLEKKRPQSKVNRGREGQRDIQGRICERWRDKHGRESKTFFILMSRARNANAPSGGASGDYACLPMHKQLAARMSWVPLYSIYTFVNSPVCRISAALHKSGSSYCSLRSARVPDAHPGYIAWPVGFLSCDAGVCSIR